MNSPIFVEMHPEFFVEFPVYTGPIFVALTPQIVTPRSLPISPRSHACQGSNPG